MVKFSKNISVASNKLAVVVDRGSVVVVSTVVTVVVVDIDGDAEDARSNREITESVSGAGDEVGAEVQSPYTTPGLSSLSPIFLALLGVVM